MRRHPSTVVAPLLLIIIDGRPRLALPASLPSDLPSLVADTKGATDNQASDRALELPSSHLLPIWYHLTPDVVVNCAALFVPRACEMDPATAVSINVPSSLVNWLSNFNNSNSLLVHLSNDQVDCVINICDGDNLVFMLLRLIAFDWLLLIIHSIKNQCELIVYKGVKSFYKEEDEAVPVNMYGKTKLATEQHIIAHCSTYAILRSSIIYGPRTISPVEKSLPIQVNISWICLQPFTSARCNVIRRIGLALFLINKVMRLNFFHDEFRCPVYVKDMVDVIMAATKKWISVCLFLHLAI
ncbi:hypothetical protein ZIOFF_039515 [Zingiber officinale]|uniref:RmlD-like substrate binding domain-containing protein n=1 Tax=Zingiber officinale TaxID=94328 RepID=A0A8J5G770_ZINOF|nr:hypothetical protein ZIOFF_039515 [Zingiber officinale]